MKVSFVDKAIFNFVTLIFPKVTNAINKIHDLENKVEAEISQITVDRWRNYHQELITQSAFIVGKELSITIDTAQSVADSVLHILDLLLPYPNIWQALNAADRRKAGRRYLTVIDRVSVLMNAHLSTNIRQSYSYRGNLIILKTIEFDYSHDLYISLNEANINLPIAGLNRPANGGISSMTAAKLLKLRQYMTPADPNVYSAVITVKVGTTVSEGSYLQLKHPHKLSITTYRDDYYHKKHCVSWKPNSSRSGWSRSGCTISYPFVYQIACECDHLSTGFGVLDESVPIDEGDSDGGDGTTPSPPVTPGNPDEIADEIDQVLGNITDVGVNSTVEQWKESVEKLTDLVSSVTANDAAIDNVSKKLALRIANASLNSFSRLIEAPRGVWQNLSTSEKRGSSSKIFKSVSNLSVLMNAKQSDGNQTVLSFSSIEMRSKLFDVSESSNIHFDFGNAAIVEVPINAVLNEHSNNLHSTYSSLPSNKTSRKIATSATLLSNISQRLSSKTLLPNSAVLSITVANRRESVSLNDGLKLKFA